MTHLAEVIPGDRTCYKCGIKPDHPIHTPTMETASEMLRIHDAIDWMRVDLKWAVEIAEVFVDEYGHDEDVERCRRIRSRLERERGI